MADAKGKDRVKTAGTMLIAVGVSMWIVYAVGRYLLGWDITDRDFLGYHLVTILPGMVLRYHRLFFEDIPGWFSRGETRAQERPHGDRVLGKRSVLMKALIIVNNFIHDLFTGLWASSILVIYLLDRKARSVEGSPLIPTLHDVMRTFFWIGVISIIVISASGRVRLLYYRNGRTGDDEEIKKELLIVKHVLFTFLFIGGTYFAYLHAFGSVRN